jgi:hypothetical protein
MRTVFLVLMLACAWPAWGQANATITGATIAGGVTIGIGAGAPGIQSWQFGVHANTASNLSMALATMGATASRNWDMSGNSHNTTWNGICGSDPGSSPDPVTAAVNTCYWTGLTDALTTLANNGGDHFIFSIFKTPTWANASGDLTRPPDAWSDLENFVRAAHRVVATWKASNPTKAMEVIYECGNEPNSVGTFWYDWTVAGGGIPAMVTYCSHVWNAIRTLEGDRTAKVLTPPLQGCGNSTSLATYLEEGGAQYASNLGFHSYCGSGIGGSKSTGNGVPAIDVMKATVDGYVSLAATFTNGDGVRFNTVPIFNTEYGFDYNSICDLAQREAYVAQIQLMEYAAGVTSSTWYALDNYNSAPTGPMWYASSHNCPLTGTNVRTYASGWDTVTRNAWTRTKGWMLAKTAGGCTTNVVGAQKVLACSFTQGGKTYKAVWDQNDAGGTYSTVGFSKYEDLDGNVNAVSGTVAISKRPVWLSQ